MSIDVVFETHSLTDGNETGVATGWLDGRLSVVGRQRAAELGARRREDGIAAVFSSDLGRARETVEIAFSDSTVPVLLDWRLRECDYGELNGAPVAAVHANRSAFQDAPYPGGESWRQATDRVRRFLEDLHLRWDGKRVLVVGHVATRWGLDCWADGASLPELLTAGFAWQKGWLYRLA
jgi:2,3-bisphosphoglycerate-dependent phosphoglycerate mutase